MSVAKSRIIDHLLIGILCTLIFLILLVEFILNLTPPIARDAIIHHLAIPKLWLKNGAFYEMKWAKFSYYPMNIDLLYIIPIYFKKDYLANFIHMGFGVGTAFLIYNYLKSRISLIAGLLGVLIFFSTPMIFRLSTQAYVDLGLIFFTTASMIAFIRYRDSQFKDFKWLFLASLTMGLALGTKYNALIALFFLSAAMVFIYSRDTKDQWKAIQCGLIFVLISFLFFSPWLIKNAILTGNPFYPLFQGLFNVQTTVTHDGTYSIVSGETYKGIFQIRESMFGENFWETLLIPVRYFFQGQDDNPRYFDGVLHPLLIVLPLFSLINKSFYCDKLFFTGFAVFFILIATFLDQTKIRYILPVVPVLTILSVMGFLNVLKWISRFSMNVKFLLSVILISVFCLFIIQNVLYMNNYYRKISPLNYLAGKESRDEFITRHNSGYAAMKYINTHTPENARIRLILFAGRGYYLDRFYEEGRSFGMVDILGLVSHAHDEKSFHSYLRSFNCTHLLIQINLFEKFLQDNYSSDTLNLFRQRMNETTKTLYNQQGCAVYEIMQRF